MKFYITTPIYYVNDEPHLGHAYTTILADVLKKYHRKLGEETYFLTGTDEHGQKVQEAADKYGVTPLEHCDKMALRFRNLWTKLQIENDDFIRTTEERHLIEVKKILQYIMDKGKIYADEFEGWYCVSDERFWTEKDLKEGNCPLCGREVRQMSERNYFFKMSEYQDWLIDHINSHPEFILPEHRRNEVLGFLRQPLKDLCISRPKSRLSWGIDLPFDADYVTYVWFDALLNYYSAVKAKGLWPADVHLIGKDILTTHCVYWPIMLKAADLQLPRTIFAHGWWLIEAEKMSKSRGNVVKPLELADRYGVDSFRYFLMRDMAPGQDASFSEAMMVNRINTDLANDFGNMLSRVTRLIKVNFNGLTPEGDDSPEWRELAESVILSVKESIENFRLDEALKAAMNLIVRANRYLEETAPWKLVKTDKKSAGAVLYNALEALRLSASLLEPVMPNKMRETLNRMNNGDAEWRWGVLKPGTKIEMGDALFPRIEYKPPAISEKKKEEVMPDIAVIDDFKKLQLRVAEIMTAEPVAGADKLYKLQIDIGGEQRQIIAGIAQHYKLDELPGKKIIVIVNLEKAVIRGVESQGMLLAAQAGKTMKLLTIDGDLPAGAKIS
ncbi:methionine--tRNA ligase [bacterium]|nr:methionine--tRNA ligase [bacterium]